MIKSLTKKQIALIPAYRDKWLKIGLSCDPFSHEEAKELIDPLYKEILQKPAPKAIIIMDNPITAWMAAPYLWLLSMTRIRKRQEK